jgi:thiamine biosynthesis protein ThiI
MGLILLRYGEIALKGRNRADFVRQLGRNVRATLKAHDLRGEVRSVGSRIHVRTAEVEAALDPLSRVFGLVSLSPVVEVPRDMGAIAAECVRQAQAAGVGPDRSFRVRARRSDKTFPYISPEIDRIAGEAVIAATQGRVDLSNATDVTIGVEVGHDAALVYGRVIAAPGGLPVSSGGRVVALLSGGIDSPVAAWLMIKRGCGVIPLHFASSDEETAKALDNVAVLSRYSYGWQLKPVIRGHFETVGPVVEKLRSIGEERWTCIFCKRALLQEAARVADTYGAHGIVMGDALGQVASQTLPNMEVISYGIAKPILRPLIGLDKTEIVDLARRIGTFEVSTRSEAGCAFLPPHPITRASVEGLLEIARRLDEQVLPA